MAIVGVQRRGRAPWRQIDYEQHVLSVIISDQAPLFNPFKNLPERSVSENLSQAGGYGLQLVKKAMDTFKYSEVKSGGNKLTLTKRI